uniref:Uncharacterized protein n=1 Tax=Dunaliella tertiolecta TaxID=3047 RepID=A0A7S3R954_DUNTE
MPKVAYIYWLQLVPPLLPEMLMLGGAGAWLCVFIHVCLACALLACGGERGYDVQWSQCPTLWSLLLGVLQKVLWCVLLCNLLWGPVKCHICAAASFLCHFCVCVSPLCIPPFVSLMCRFVCVFAHRRCGVMCSCNCCCLLGVESGMQTMAGVKGEELTNEHMDYLRALLRRFTVLDEVMRQG